MTASVDPTKQNIYHENSANMQNDWVKTTGFDWSNHPSNILALQHATGLSLPNTQQLISLLKNLSIRLAGKCLVTKVVQCQQCYYTEEQASMTWPGDSGEFSSGANCLVYLCQISHQIQLMAGKNLM